MWWVEAGVQRTKSLAAVAMLLLAAVMLQGCWVFGGGPHAAIPDGEMTAEAFDDTIAFEPGDDAEEAVPPLEVHEIDESQATAAGGKKVVDGRNWLDASDFERNDILNLVAEAKPEGSILVIVVATGDIWQIPLVAGQMLPDGVRAWSGDEYYEMDEYNDRPPLGYALTQSDFAKLTMVTNSDSLGTINYVHPFGETGYREIKTWQGFQVALARTWLRETPVQRYLRLTMFNNYFGRLPQFQGEGNRIAFGVMVPGGGVYVMPESAYRTMIVRRAILLWTSSEIFSLPTTLLLLDRQIKNTRIVVEPIDP